MGRYCDALGTSCGRCSRGRPLFGVRTHVSTTFRVQNTSIDHFSSSEHKYWPLFKLRTHVSTKFQVENTSIDKFSSSEHMYRPIFKLRTHLSTNFQIENTSIDQFSSWEHTYRLPFVASWCDRHPFSVFNFQQESLRTRNNDTTQMWPLANWTAAYGVRKSLQLHKSSNIVFF